MALARVTPLLDQSATAVSSGDVSTGYNLSSLMAAGRKLYAGAHVFQNSSETLQLLVQSASSSGFGTATTEFVLPASTQAGGFWGTSGGVGIGSTDRVWWRQRFTLSTASNAPSAKFLGWISIQ